MHTHTCLINFSLFSVQVHGLKKTKMQQIDTKNIKFKTPLTKFTSNYWNIKYYDYLPWSTTKNYSSHMFEIN